MGATHREEIEETSDQLKKVTASRVGYVLVIGEEYSDVSKHIIDAICKDHLSILSTLNNLGLILILRVLLSFLFLFPFLLVQIYGSFMTGIPVDSKGITQ